MTAAERSGHIVALDALRGVAAAIVLAHHLFIAFQGGDSRAGLILSAATWADPWTWGKLTPLAGLVAGRAPVIIFFVLSGFVLALPFARGRAPAFGDYLVKRVCRIYLPFAAAILAAAGLAWLARPEPVAELSRWFNETSWTLPPEPGLVLRHLAMTGRTEDMTLDNVMWSLVHEMRISLIFPLIPLLVLRSRLTAIAVALACYLAGKLGARIAPDGTFVASLVDTLRFSAFFFAGALMAFERTRIAAIAARIGGAGASALAVAALSLMAVAPNALAEIGYGVAAVLLIGMALGTPAAVAVLARGPAVWLGRVSYSLYLIHLPILLFAFHTLHGVVPDIAIVFGVAAVSLVAAQLAYVLVEKPSIALGRRLVGPGRARAAAQPS